MRSHFGKSRRHWYLRIELLAAIVLFIAIHRADSALGQSQTPSAFPQTPAQNRPPFGQEPETTQDPMLRRAQEDAAKKRNIERQKKLLADSDRIVQLAKELSAAAEPNPQDPTPPGMAKKAEEIEKLARSVKELMKSE